MSQKHFPAIRLRKRSTQRRGDAPDTKKQSRFKKIPLSFTPYSKHIYLSKLSDERFVSRTALRTSSTVVLEIPCVTNTSSKFLKIKQNRRTPDFCFLKMRTNIFFSCRPSPNFSIKCFGFSGNNDNEKKFWN